MPSFSLAMTNQTNINNEIDPPPTLPTLPTLPSPPPEPSPAPTQVPEEDNGPVTTQQTQISQIRRTLSLLASPLHDERGSARSVLAGLCSLFIIGATIGLVLPKNPALPTVWYRNASAAIGYIYFVCWSVSFYPQLVANFKRKSTQGLSADFCGLNVLGFVCYTAYNVSFYWSPAIQKLYRERHGPSSEITVQSNDVAFAMHALLLSSLTFVQIGYYGGLRAQQPSKMILAIILLILLLCSSYPCLIFATKKQTHSPFNWLDYLYLLSFIKIGISLIKYIPQVILNYQRRSTVGWSIWNIILDFTGGTLSILQLVLDCSDLGDFTGITGNSAKFGLGFVSIIFDICFMMQHYVLFADSGSPEAEPLLSEEDRAEPPRPRQAMV